MEPERETAVPPRTLLAGEADLQFVTAPLRQRALTCSACEEPGFLKQIQVSVVGTPVYSPTARSTG